jgi:hypothetical protein
MTEKVGLIKTREELIDLLFVTETLGRKAQCRAVHGDILDQIHDVSQRMRLVDHDLTELIGN